MLPAGARIRGTATAGPTVSIGDNRVTFGNGLVERTWTLAPFRTERLVDLRTGCVWSEGSNDLRLTIGGAELRGDQLAAKTPTQEPCLAVARVSRSTSA